ncbi:MAG: carbon starvation CstA family protein [Kiritimatiellia bacterium]
MFWFLGGMLALVIGYLTYGKKIVDLLNPDDRKTPAYTLEDGVDYVPLPAWKNMLIQLLNIAGVGPVIGVIIGIKFGWVCFWIIPLGCILGGAVHDCVAGFMSLRSNGANLPALTAKAFGRWYTQAYSVFVLFLLLLVVAVFINVPSHLVVGLASGVGHPTQIFWWAVAVIFLYYILATLFSVDKIIGRIYPFFGALLLIGSLAMLVMLIIHGVREPWLLTESAGFQAGMFKDQPIIPCLFVTIACGIISGFHATQSPIVARTMRSERQVRCTYYGMMIVEGLIAMIWAAAGMAIYNLRPELMSLPATQALVASTEHFLGTWMGKVTIASVIVLAVTSGDTALRSLRLTLAEMLHVPQKTLQLRLLLCLPLIAGVCVLLWWSHLSVESFEYLWRYFAWGNQILSASTLMTCTVWLMRRKVAPWYTLLPGMFMTFIVASFILWSDTRYSGCPYGLGLPLNTAYAIAGVFTFFCAVSVLRLGNLKEE